MELPELVQECEASVLNLGFLQVKGCGKTSWVQGWCNHFYARWVRVGRTQSGPEGHR